jgi:hypothetical protein
MTGAGYAAYGAALQAIKASGVLVQVEPTVFLSLVGKADEPVVVVAYGGAFRKRYQYLTSYKGLAFYTTSPTALPLSRAELVAAKSIRMPQM